MEEYNFREYAHKNILTTSEVAEKLKVTRQRLNVIVSSGELTPFKKTPQVTLFFSADVDDYLTKKGHKSRQVEISPPAFFDREGSTFESIDYFKKNRKYLGEIVASYSYFDEVDACLDNFFLPSKTMQYGEILWLDIPGLVLVDSKGKQMWLSGCNCGYGGTGPHGTAEILKLCGFQDKDIQNVFHHRVVKFYKQPTGEVNVDAREGYLIDEKTKGYPNSGSAGLYFHKGHLVILQNDYGSDPEILLQRFRAFIPHPVEVLILPDIEQARDKGYVIPRPNRYMTFNTIVKDLSGKELWLRTEVNHRPIAMQPNLLDLLKACGFNVSNESPIIGWAKTLLRLGTPSIEPIIYTKE